MITSIKDCTNALERVLHGTMCLSKVGAVIGTATAKVTTGATAVYAIAGVLYSKAATADCFTLAGPILAANSTQYFLLGFNAAGTAVTVAGLGSTAVTANGAADSMAGKLPEIPVDLTPGATFGQPTMCPVAILKVVTAGSTFTPGTTALTGIATYTDIMLVPNDAP
jgi:hypothetical protein